MAARVVGGRDHWHQVGPRDWRHVNIGVRRGLTLPSISCLRPGTAASEGEQHAER